MLPAAKTPAEVQSQRNKLTTSYNELLEEFSSPDLRTVGSYALGRLIGKGSFGKVYLGSHKLINGSKVVLKSADKSDPNLPREIHHHRQFLHPHIARLYEVIATESSVWLVLEFCPGDELYNYLTHHGKIEPERVQKIFTQLVGAVAYVHSKSCVHRDLKLENILLDKNENVKLCDFGFTREYEGKASYLQTWCGTVCYSAPEMLKGEKYAGEKVDVWSLGIILYALLCGELPFDEDDDDATKMKILKEEPKYPDHLPTPAKELIVNLLSKRPLLRPSLADILTNPWLSEHAPQQQAILKVQQPAAFTTDLEKEVLQRMRSAGVNIDTVIENVLSQRCDSLAGWWALLLDKEERKEKRRLRKRKERDADGKAARRISTASGRLLAATIVESEEEKADSAERRDRGRELHRTPLAASPVLKQLPENRSQHFTSGSPRPATKRVSSASGRRSQLGTGDGSKRGSTLQVITNAELLAPPEPLNQKRKRRYPPPFFNQLANIKHWFKVSNKKGRGGNAEPTTARLAHSAQSPHQHVRRISTDSYMKRNSGGYLVDVAHRAGTFPQRPRISTHESNGSIHRITSASHSPSPLTPQSSYRRTTSGGNLRGRKSTSSSVSSVRSIHGGAQASHSKGSSVSTTSMVSPSASAKSIPTGTVIVRGSSPNPIKILPAPPASSPQTPSGMKVVRPPALRLPNSPSVGGAGAFSAQAPPSPGLVFTKRKRTPFRGPMLGPGLSSRRRSDGSGGQSSRSGSVQGRTSGDAIQDIQEEEDDEEDVEEVDSFQPLDANGNVIESEDALDDPGGSASPAPIPPPKWGI